MADNFLAEIRAVGFNFAPTGWALCNGQIMAISQNTALFSLLGTTYGGNGTSNFALPNLQGMTPMGFGQGPGLSDRVLGETAGETSVTLLQSEMPSHNHTFSGGSNGRFGGVNAVAGNEPGTSGTNTDMLYSTAAANGTIMSPLSLQVTGGNQPHNNMMPYQCVNFIIALRGIFPARG